MKAEMHELYLALSGWKCFMRIDLMIKKQKILLLQNHLKEVFKDECTAMDAKFEEIPFRMDRNDRAHWNEQKNRKKTGNASKHKFNRNTNGQRKAIRKSDRTKRS